MCGMLWSLSIRLSKGAHLALCVCNEREQAFGPDVARDQDTSVCVFPLTASGPLWNQIRCGGRDLRPELRDASQVAGTAVNWQLPLATSAREALAVTWKALAAYRVFKWHNHKWSNMCSTSGCIHEFRSSPHTEASTEIGMPGVLQAVFPTKCCANHLHLG